MECSVLRALKQDLVQERSLGALEQTASDIRVNLLKYELSFYHKFILLRKSPTSSQGCAYANCPMKRYALVQEKDCSSHVDRKKRSSLVRFALAQCGSAYREHRPPTPLLTYEVIRCSLESAVEVFIKGYVALIDGNVSVS